MRRLLVSVDARGYGAASAGGQDRIQKGLLHVLDEAAERAGLARRRWTRQPGGDGELAVLPDTEPEPRVVEDFPLALASALTVHNRDLRPERQLRLRLAIHHGVAFEAENGFTGAGPVEVSRLCDSPLFKEALANSGADLAVIYSRQVFTDTVQQELTGLVPERLLEVRVTQKEFDQPAWIWVPGHDITNPASIGPAPGPATRACPDLAGGIDAVICSAEQDIAAVELLALELRHRGVTVWIEPWVDPGQIVVLARERAIDAAASGVLVFSEATASQPAIMDDYAALLTRVHEPGGHRFVPVLLEKVKLPRFAALRRPLDLTGEGGNIEGQIDLLARALRSDTLR